MLNEDLLPFQDSKCPHHFELDHKYLNLKNDLDKKCFDQMIKNYFYSLTVNKGKDFISKINLENEEISIDKDDFRKVSNFITKYESKENRKLYPDAKNEEFKRKFDCLKENKDLLKSKPIFLLTKKFRRNKENNKERNVKKNLNASSNSVENVNNNINNININKDSKISKPNAILKSNVNMDNNKNNNNKINMNFSNNNNNINNENSDNIPFKPLAPIAIRPTQNSNYMNNNINNNFNNNIFNNNLNNLNLIPFNFNNNNFNNFKAPLNVFKRPNNLFINNLFGCNYINNNQKTTLDQ